MTNSLKMVWTFTAAVLLIVLVTACGQQGKESGYSSKAVQKVQENLKEPDYWPTVGWKTSSPEQQGMDSNLLAEVYNNLEGKKIDSMLVVRNGYLVAEGYSSEYSADTSHDVFSVTKSVLSALIGIAIHEKKMPDVDAKVADYLPYPEIKSDKQKKDISIKNFLSMTPGLKWDNTNENSTTAMTESDDWVKYVLDQPVVAESGTQFEYSNGNPHVLSAVFQSQTGQTAYDYAKEKLFAPLGITNSSWSTDNKGIQNGAYSLHLTPQDMAKIGYLYLHEGKWEDQQVIPEEWIKDSLSKQTSFTYFDKTEGGYGYFWWLKPLVYEENGEKVSVNTYYAAGSGDQRIFLIPELNLEVVFTAHNNEDELLTERLLQMVVANAKKSDKTLPENVAAAEQLDKAIQAFKLFGN